MMSPIGSAMASSSRSDVPILRRRRRPRSNLQPTMLTPRADRLAARRLVGLPQIAGDVDQDEFASRSRAPMGSLLGRPAGCRILRLARSVRHPWLVPLFMDRHEFTGLTAVDAAAAHLKDLEVQGQ